MDFSDLICCIYRVKCGRVKLKSRGAESDGICAFKVHIEVACSILCLQIERQEWLVDSTLGILVIVDQSVRLHICAIIVETEFEVLVNERFSTQLYRTHSLL